MQYGGAGHVAVNALFWFGFDLADLTWKRIGPRAIASNALSAWPTVPAAFSDTHGDWDGAHASLPEAFRQPGNTQVPEGSHTRNRMVYRPPGAAGNANGQIIVAWHATGYQDATGVGTAHTWNATTQAWARHENQRTSYGGHIGALLYHPGADVVVGPSAAFGASADHLDYLTCSSMTWARRTITSGGRTHDVDATAFAWTDINGKEWHVVCRHLDAAAPSFDCFAARVDEVVSGGATWTDLTLSGSTWPVDGTGSRSWTVQWARCPIDGNYYAVNRTHGSNKIWKLAPPGNGLITGTWTITDQTLTGSTLEGRNNSSGNTSFDYSRLHWSSYANAFLWTGDQTNRVPQAIRPQGV
jgi:hypothetical protein